MSGCSLRKTLNKDLARFYPIFDPTHFTPYLPTLPPVDPEHDGKARQFKVTSKYAKYLEQVNSLLI